MSLSLSSAACHARLRFDRYLSKRGQSMTEYLVALAVLAAMLASTGIGDPPVLQLFLESVQAGWARLLSALALPV
ncbi:MAG TPA: hypothetical protein VJU53_13355 [Burkholderiaceae bacterium]|nr:hypothetical protein [Burkholderiaceae bacterium]